VKDSVLTFVLYGEGRDEPCRLESEVVERIPYRNLCEDGTEATDTATLLSPGREGVRSRLYRIQNGKRYLIRENVYAKKDAIYKKVA